MENFLLREAANHDGATLEGFLAFLGQRMVATLDFEHHTSHPAPGEVLLYPGGYSETEILFPYGGTCFASTVGQRAGNHFLTVTDGREQLRELGRLVLWEGAQDVRFERSVGCLKDFADPETPLRPVLNGKNILEEGNSNFALLDDPEINKAMDDAEVSNDPAEQEWGEVDKRLTEKAAGIPWLWDKQPILRSADVNGVVSQSNAAWDLTFTSLK